MNSFSPSAHSENVFTSIIIYMQIKMIDVHTQITLYECERIYSTYMKMQYRANGLPAILNSANKQPYKFAILYLFSLLLAQFFRFVFCNSFFFHSADSMWIRAIFGLIHHQREEEKEMDTHTHTIDILVKWLKKKKNRRSQRGKRQRKYLIGFLCIAKKKAYTNGKACSTFS